MKLGLQLGYWSAQPPTNHAEMVAAAEESGFDTVFTAEAWGSDAFTPGVVGPPDGMRLGTRWCNCRAHADRLRDGLADPGPSPAAGTSWVWASRGPQVVEGWYGQRFPSHWRAPGSTSTSSVRCGPGRPGYQPGPALPAAIDR